MSLKRYNGSAWTDVAAFKRYSGSACVDCEYVRRWDGSAWVDVWTGKRMTFFYNRSTATCDIVDNVATIDLTAASADNGTAGMVSNFNLAASDIVSITYQFTRGSTGSGDRSCVIAVGDTIKRNSTADVSGTYQFTAETSGELAIYLDSSSYSASVPVNMSLTISSVTVNGIPIKLSES